jgi:glycosyltransferase involved in cell wall biosynthesis
MNNASFPMITVVISTRNRSRSILRSVQSVLNNDYPLFELRVVDQSDDDKTAVQLQPLQGNATLSYVKKSARGLSLGRNLGVDGARGELIAFTDDDCEVPPDWLHRIRNAFAADPLIGVVLGNVIAGAHDSKAGFIPTYFRKDSFQARSVTDKPKIEGIGACMSVQRRVWKDLKGFDSLLGAGAPFKSAEETDFIIRALRAGYHVYETPEVEVTHHGFRTWDEGPRLIQGHLYGLGAMFAKHMKIRNWKILSIFLHLLCRWMWGQPVVNFGFFPSRRLRMMAFIKGFFRGAIMPLDENKCHFDCRRMK